jgi:hypothetical protein
MSKVRGVALQKKHCCVFDSMLADVLDAGTATFAPRIPQKYAISFDEEIVR